MKRSTISTVGTAVVAASTTKPDERFDEAVVEFDVGADEFGDLPLSDDLDTCDGFSLFDDDVPPSFVDDPTDLR